MNLLILAPAVTKDRARSLAGSALSVASIKSTRPTEASATSTKAAWPAESSGTAKSTRSRTGNAGAALSTPRTSLHHFAVRTLTHTGLANASEESHVGA